MNYTEQYELGIQRIQCIQTEETTKLPYRNYFRDIAAFLLQIDKVYRQVCGGMWDHLSLEEMQAINRDLYGDILGEAYEESYANPSYAVGRLGKQNGQLLCALYAELRGEVVYAFREKEEYLTICNGLFIQIYNVFEQDLKEEEYHREIQQILYWHMSDYCDVFLADRVREQLDSTDSFAMKILQNRDKKDLRYLYRFGEYISENELGTARFLQELSEGEIQQMAAAYTEGYRTGFLNTGKDLSIKKTVDIRYHLGFERMIDVAVEQFGKMGLSPVMYAPAVSAITRKGTAHIGYEGAVANRQYDYDHRNDQGLFLDKKYTERKLEVLEHTYEQCRKKASWYAGPAVLEVFGEEPFLPAYKEEAIVLSEKQREWALQYDGKASQLVNRYVKGEERSFTIIAFPLPAIGKQYDAVFRDTIRINTLDAERYSQMQQTLINALDQGYAVHIMGKGDNRTNLTVALQKLEDPSKETLFENCVADVNIPVGEVFTSPKLEGTNGVLQVSRVFLNELLYLDLELVFEEGWIKKYHCGNFPEEEKGKTYIHDNLLFRHETLPLGEFAIGTNTVAYVMANLYGIQERLPILIAEKMGPHFAVGDTCYSWEENNHVYNPDGKEIIAKENTCSAQRTTDPEKAYFQCHTDITIPYEELGLIEVLTREGEHIAIIKDGRFVLPGTEELNKPFDNA